MLFSDKNLANYLDENYECAWESVRPVPIMSVDFGDGRVVSRSMHGNVATYVCLADKTVVDILPGIYGPRTYKRALEILHKLSLQTSRLIPKERVAKLRNFHQHENDRIYNEMNSITLGRIMGLHPMPSTVAEEPEVRELGNENYYRGILADDAMSETSRRLITHGILHTYGLATPDLLTKQVYKQCLDLDLDDPYLGLKEALTSNYPGES